MNLTKTLVKSALSTSNSGKRLKDISVEVGVPYASVVNTINNMVLDNEAEKVDRGVYRLTSVPSFNTFECIALLETLHGQEIKVQEAQAKLNEAQANLKAIKSTIKATMLTAFED